MNKIDELKSKLNAIQKQIADLEDAQKEWPHRGDFYWSTTHSDGSPERVTNTQDRCDPPV